MNNKFKILVEQALEEEFKPRQQETKFMPRLVLIAFILLMIYLLVDAFSSKNKLNSNEIRVFGFYSGTLNKDSKKTIVINLENNKDIDSLDIESKAGIKNDEFQQLNEKQTPQPQKISKKDIFSQVILGTTYESIVSKIGKPTKNMQIVHNDKSSGFTMKIWDGSPKLIGIFYKNKLITKN